MTTFKADSSVVGKLFRSGGVLVTVVGVEGGRARVRDVTGGAEEMMPVVGLEGINGELSRWVGAPLFVQLEAQPCLGGHAVEEGDAVEVDVAPVLAEMGNYERGRFLENLSVSRGVVPDVLYFDAVDRGLMDSRYSPLRCDLSADDVALWCAANPYRPPQPRTAVPDGFTDRAAQLREQVRAGRRALIAISIVELAIQLHNQIPGTRYALLSNLLTPDDWLLVDVCDSYEVLQADHPTRCVNARVPHIPDVDPGLFAEAAGTCSVGSVTGRDPTRHVAIDLLAAASAPEARILKGRL